MRQTSPREYERLTQLRYQDGAVAGNTSNTQAMDFDDPAGARGGMRERRIIDRTMSNASSARRRQFGKCSTAMRRGETCGSVRRIGSAS